MSPSVLMPSSEAVVASLDRVGASVVGLAVAEAEYKAALLAALNAGAGYAEVARAAGVSRQAVRVFALNEWAPAKVRAAR